MFRRSGNLNFTKKDTFETFVALLIVKDDFKSTVILEMYILY